jgi:serine/threonine protein kinase
VYYGEGDVSVLLALSNASCYRLNGARVSKDVLAIEENKQGQSGGNGMVMRASYCGEPVVLKRLKIAGMADDLSNKGIEREYRIGAGLRSNYIVQHLGKPSSPRGGKELLLEACHGKTLDKQIKSSVFQRLNDQEKLIYLKNYMAQMLIAVQYIHENDIAHKDLKPENFMFKDRALGAQLKLLDFGAAVDFKVDDREQLYHETFGWLNQATLFYTPPEDATYRGLTQFPENEDSMSHTEKKLKAAYTQYFDQQSSQTEQGDQAYLPLQSPAPSSAFSTCGAIKISDLRNMEKKVMKKRAFLHDMFSLGISFHQMLELAKIKDENNPEYQSLLTLSDKLLAPPQERPENAMDFAQTAHEQDDAFFDLQPVLAHREAVFKDAKTAAIKGDQKAFCKTIHQLLSHHTHDTAQFNRIFSQLLKPYQPWLTEVKAQSNKTLFYELMGKLKTKVLDHMEKHFDKLTKEDLASIKKIIMTNRDNNPSIFTSSFEQRFNQIQAKKCEGQRHRASIDSTASLSGRSLSTNSDDRSDHSSDDDRGSPRSKK